MRHGKTQATFEMVEAMLDRGQNVVICSPRGNIVLGPDTARDITPSQQEPLMLEAPSKLSRRDMDNLHVGDVVTIFLRHYTAPDPRCEPFTVTLKKITPREDMYNMTGERGEALIHWDVIEEHGRLAVGPDNLDGCSTGFITHIVQKAPFRPKWETKNIYYTMKRKDPRHYSLYKIPGTNKYVLMGGYLYAFSSLLQDDPYLDIPYGLDEDRLGPEWFKDGRPGMIGYYDFFRDKFYRHSRNHPGLIDDENNYHEYYVLDLTKVKRWLRQNLHRLKRTRAKLRLDGIESARKEWDDYVSDMSYIDSRGNTALRWEREMDDDILDDEASDDAPNAELMEELMHHEMDYME